MNIEGPNAIRAAFARLTAAVPDARGVLIQALVAEGVDALVGTIRRDAFGHMVGCGVGGSLTEAIGLVDFRIHPLTDRDAQDLVQDNPIGRLLAMGQLGASRSRIPLQDVLLRISALVGIAPEIVEADLNPVRVLPDGPVLVIDARVRCKR